MELIDVKAVPIVKVKGPLLAPPYFPHYNVINEEGLPSSDYGSGIRKYSSAGSVHKFMTGFTLPKTPVYSGGHLIAGHDADEFPGQITTSGLSCRGSLEPQATDVDMKFYLKFENTNDSRCNHHPSGGIGVD